MCLCCQPKAERGTACSAILKKKKKFSLKLKKEQFSHCFDRSDQTSDLNELKLPRVLAPLSRHSSCYMALQLLLAARLVVSGSLPSPLCCKHKSITAINLAGERHREVDCFAPVKLNTTIFPFCSHTLRLMSTGRCVL